MATKKEIKLQTIKENRSEIVEAIKEAIQGSDVSLKDAMNTFLAARTKNPQDLSMLMCNGLQAVTKLADKVGCRANKNANRKHFMTDHAKRLFL